MTDPSHGSAATPRARERIATGEWQPFAPVNIQPDGRIYRKTRFDTSPGGPMGAEWMWVEVSSLEDREGILTNQSIGDESLGPGTMVRFRIIPEGQPLDGCAVAVDWTPPA